MCVGILSTGISFYRNSVVLKEFTSTFDGNFVLQAMSCTGQLQKSRYILVVPRLLMAIFTLFGHNFYIQWVYHKNDGRHFCFRIPSLSVLLSLCSFCASGTYSLTTAANKRRSKNNDDDDVYGNRHYFQHSPSTYQWPMTLLHQLPCPNSHLPKPSSIIHPGIQ
jgi:hypothetical protein